jgi:hypothetical protein
VILVAVFPTGAHDSDVVAPERSDTIRFFRELQ